MSAIAPEAAREVMRIVLGFRLSQAVYVFAKLRIPDALGDRCCTAEELAVAVGAQPAPLYRLLRALASADVLEEDIARRFRLTPAGHALRSDITGSLRSRVLLYGEESYRAFGDLLHTVKTGETAFKCLFGAGLFEYIARDDAAAETFHLAMNAGTDNFFDIEAAYDFTRFDMLVDVGGGYGSVTARILRSCPKLTAIVFDLPSVVSPATAYLARVGLLGRCQVRGGDFFESVPANGDIYLLASVLHDWDDDRAVRILSNCRDAMGAEGVLLIAERVLAPPGQPCPGKVDDLTMLAVTGGREREEEEFIRILTAAGFSLASVTPCGSDYLLEAIPS